jgi:hypothetical protein
MKIFVIGGKAKSGKNTFGEKLKKHLIDYGYKPCIMHITEPLYTYAKNYFMYDAKNDEKPREFLQKMGIEIIKEKMGKKTFLIDRLFEDIEILENFFDTFIITDARLIEEFEDIKKNYGDVVNIKLERDNYDPELSEEEAKHITEHEIDTYDGFDYVIKNRNLVDLRRSALEVVRDEENYEGSAVTIS